ncbi:MAG TPA: cation transporter [Campylobacter avium]|uniref:heavy-metal-associated domain-containing protein n=1 Tax=Campylobacter avium TaxID=522485 RepID=UPI001DDFA288|nr:cation transporter [Campylobacter avium]HJE65448.1 cation transporter [Campylobacter avium]
MKSFEVDNVNCINCANLIKNSLKDEFGDIDVNLDKKPATISLKIQDDKIASLKEALKDLNFPILRAL